VAYYQIILSFTSPSAFKKTFLSGVMQNNDHFTGESLQCIHVAIPTRIESGSKKWKLFGIWVFFLL